ncbi:hypothetical protein AZ007_000276 [Citrobacter freundii]|nr:hypothetical protein AZ007_000276 [Citrobacter freundii]
MSNDLSEAMQQYMIRVSSDFEKFKDHCVIVAYISNCLLYTSRCV